MAVRLIEAIANIENFERLDGGSLKVHAIARTPGILTYYDSNGPRRELVTSAFLRSTDDTGFPLAGQLAELPVTLEHPPSLLRNDATKIQQYSVGKTAPKVKVYEDGRIQVEMEVSADEAIQAVESGAKRGVSLGYLCDINRTDGVYNGARYDAEQCAPFEADHLAIVASPRATNALIQSFERTDSEEDFAVALYEEFEESPSNIVDSPRSDSMGTETAATVAISDTLTVPDTFQIEINGNPHRVDAQTYADIQAERADMKKKVTEAMDEVTEDDDEYAEGKRKDAAEQLSLLLQRCDADTLPDAIHNLTVLVSRFDGVETVADAVDSIDQLQGRVDALSDDTSSSRFDSTEVEALLKKLDADTPAAALLQLEGKDFVDAHGHMLPAGFKLDGQTLHDLRLAALNNVKPGLKLRNDSESAVEGAFSAIAQDYRRVDSSSQLDKALHSDGVNSDLPTGANRQTRTSIMQKPSDSLFGISKAARRN